MMKRKVRTSSGRMVIREKRGRVQVAKCSNCKKQLHGTPRLHVVELLRLSKTELRPSRAYGGNMCANCTRELFREKARNM